MFNLVAIGELLIDFVPEQAGSQLHDAASFRKAAGGAPANVAVGAARLGSRTAFIGKVGQDAFGEHLRDLLADNGVETRGLRLDPDWQTTLAFVSLEPDGDRDFVFYRRTGADTRLEQHELDLELLRSTRLLHFGSVSLTDEPARSATLAAVEAAAAAGALISFDPNVRLPLWSSAEDARAQILAALEPVSILKVSAEELEFLTGSSDPAAAAQLPAPALKLLLVSLGADGVRWWTPDHTGHMPGFTVQTVDTTGAGDALMAAVLHELTSKPELVHNGLPEPALREILCRANGYAALTTMRYGAIPALPTATKLASFLARAGCEGEMYA